MHDISAIRTDPNAFDAALAKRNIAPASEKILALDKQKRENLTSLQELQQQRNQLAQDIGKAKKDNLPIDALRADAETVNAKIQNLEITSNNLLEELLMQLPNLPAEDVPVGKDEHANKEIRRIGTLPSFSFSVLPHYILGEQSGQLDFEESARMSGARFSVLKNELALLERGLAAFMLDINIEKFGYTEISPPYLVREQALYGTGQLPHLKEDVFQTTDGYFLIPTAEVPLTNLVREKILQPSTLPLRFTAYTPSFRSEAGSAGRDTRGLIRLHQFMKVELVTITTASAAEEELERMTSIAEHILQLLGLAYRVMLLSSGDMGFSAKKTYDLEVWLPAQNCYREISSCSWCGDFQARRMTTRVKKEKTTEFVHTLNGSALPLQRTIAAILENFQQEDGSVKIPTVLQPYMKGKEYIFKKTTEKRKSDE